MTLNDSAESYMYVIRVLLNDLSVSRNAEIAASPFCIALIICKVNTKKASTVDLPF